MVDVRVVFDAGSARDGEHAGLASLTNQMLSQGAANLDADGIAARFDSLGAQFGASSLRDMAVLSLRSLTEPKLLQPALATLADIVQRPTFPANALSRERKQVLVALRDEEQSPDAVAAKAFYAALYPDYPYGTPELGTAASVKGLTRAELRDFYRRYYVARNAVVAIVGDVDRAQAAVLAERIVGGLPAGDAAPVLPAVPTLTQAHTITREFPATQTTILVGQPGMRRGDPDYFALYVGNHILGGSGFGSRILKNIREDRGLAYSAYSYFMPMRQDGPFIMGLQTRTKEAGAAHRLLLQTLRDFVAQGPTAAELQHAKENITGGFPLRIASNKNIVEYLAMIGFYHLPLDYLDQFNARVEAVTAAQVRDAFQRRVHPDRLVTVVVGRDAASAQ